MIRKSLSASVLLLALPCLATTTTPVKKTNAATTTHTSSHAATRKTTTVSHSRKTTKQAATKQTLTTAHHQPAAMDTERATRIQQALIRGGYLSGEPTGVWDAQSVAAMQKMQGENGWQTKITPDSRALIKLGLGGQSEVSTSTPAASGGGQ